MMQLADKDIKTPITNMFYMLKDVKENMNEEKNYVKKRTKWNC